MMMKIDNELLRQIESDLSLNVPFVKGRVDPVRNCWHFYTDGNAVDSLFHDKDDFVDGMNRVFVVREKHKVIILAFCLMDTHVHFVLHGEYDNCNKFMHDYIYHTSIRISRRHNEKSKLFRIPISHQAIDNDLYLKSVICYAIKNAPVGGLGFTACDYPWSSGGLYFRDCNPHYAPVWTKILEQKALEHNVLGHNALKHNALGHNALKHKVLYDPVNASGFFNILKLLMLNQLSVRAKRNLFKSKELNYRNDILIIDGVIFPGEYVAYELVERIFKTHKSFNYFMCRTKDEDIEKLGGRLSELSIPLHELRQHRDEICLALFNTDTIRNLTPQQRLQLARAIKSKLNSSPKQICRLCGLIYPEIKDLL